jgi:hypothetical protein
VRRGGTGRHSPLPSATPTPTLTPTPHTHPHTALKEATFIQTRYTHTLDRKLTAECSQQHATSSTLPVARSQ